MRETMSSEQEYEAAQDAMIKALKRVRQADNELTDAYSELKQAKTRLRKAKLLERS